MESIFKDFVQTNVVGNYSNKLKVDLLFERS